MPTGEVWLGRKLPINPLLLCSFGKDSGARTHHAVVAGGPPLLYDLTNVLLEVLQFLPGLSEQAGPQAVRQRPEGIRQFVNQALLILESGVQCLRLVFGRCAAVREANQSHNSLRGEHGGQAYDEPRGAARDEPELRDVVADCSDSLFRASGDAKEVIDRKRELVDREADVREPTCRDIARSLDLAKQTPLANAGYGGGRAHGVSYEPADLLPSCSRL